MADRSWKRTERQIARLIGGERVPVSGRARGDQPDIRHDWLSVEVTHRQTLPDWIHDAIRQAVASVRGEQLPLAILHQSGSRHTDDLVVMRLSDFQEWFGGVNDD